MKLDFIVNYRLDSPLNSNIRVATLQIPEPEVKRFESKEEYLLYFCGKIAGLCDICRFYKNIQIMAPFLERPIRIKYLVALPNDNGIILDASLKETELQRKAKELKYCFEIATEQNKSDLNIKYPILLTPNLGTDTTELENNYKIRIMTLNEAIAFIEAIVNA